MWKLFFENGCLITYSKMQRGNLFQPVVSHGILLKKIPLLLDEKQIERAENSFKKINSSKMDFDFFVLVVTGGYKIAMVNNIMHTD
jgi:hypothetical protein